MNRLLGTTLRVRCCIFLSLACVAGCGTTRSRSATEQLLVSDAVDRTIAQIDFRALSGEKVYLDTQYLKTVKGVGFANADYIVSALRQQMVAAQCLLQDTKDAADFVVEPRIGALGTNSHEITYGVPSSNLASTAASLMPTLPAVPTIPEISLAKKDDQTAAAKIAIFAYHRETKRPVWQSGTSVAKSTSKDLWVLGAGPFQNGTIYDGAQFAGSRIGLPLLGHDENRPSSVVAYSEEHYFPSPTAPSVAKESPSAEGIRQVSHEEAKKSKEEPVAKPVPQKKSRTGNQAAAK